MAKTADIGGKRLISLAPDAWIKWVTGQPGASAREILSGEFQWLSRETDALVRAMLPGLGEFLVLIELQLRYQRRMPRRLRAYAGLAEEKYELPVYPVLINILPPGPKMVIASAYESELLGLRARQDYRVINFWEVDAEEVFRQPLPALAPFVPVMKGGAEKAMVQRALTTVRADERLQEMESLLAFFASFVLEINLVKQIMRWDMDVLLQSPWYQEIERSGEAKIVLHQLTKRFGLLDEQTREQVRRLSATELEELAAALFEFKEREELNAWLSGHNLLSAEPRNGNSTELLA